MNDTRFIQIIEDNEQDFEAVERCFQKAGCDHQFHWIKNGDEAIEYYQNLSVSSREQLPNMVLLDLNLPGCNGKEIVEYLKKSPRFKHIPVIVFSTSQLDSDINECYTAGANCYLQKPVSYVELTRVIACLNEFWLNLVALPTHK